MSEKQIELKNLTIFVNNRPILKNFNFSIEKGDFIVILGENGCGKSTLMRTILGMKKEFDGELSFENGFSLKDTGYIPQQSAVEKDFPATVEEIVLSGCLNGMGFKPFYSKKEREVASEKMERLGISSISRKSFKNLSGGQQQRVLLARALCSAKKMLLLDEPFSALDPNVTEEMYILMEELNKNGITIVMISHDKENATKRANKILDFSDKSIGVVYE